jgi:hypothetical protein
VVAYGTGSGNGMAAPAMGSARWGWVVLVLWALFGSATPARAKLISEPGISHVAIRAGDPETVLLKLTGLSCAAAISTNGGLSFSAHPAESLSTGWLTNMEAGGLRYFLADSQLLFRSDDGGRTWKATAATKFVRTQARADADAEEKIFRADYADRLPERSPLWHPLFGAFSIAYITLTYLAMREGGSLRAILTGLQGLLILVLVWMLLWVIHAQVLLWSHAQFPEAHWNTSSRGAPSAKLGFVMTIAAQPARLFGYLLFLWPILPGSREVIVRLLPAKREMLSWVVCLAAWVWVVGLHAWVICVGYLFESW